MEHLRGLEKTAVQLDDVLSKAEHNGSQSAFANEEKLAREKQFDCLEKCAAKLEPASREIIISYYAGAERAKINNRRAMAEKLGVSPNALSIRACRIREKLEICIGKCLAET